MAASTAAQFRAVRQQGFALRPLVSWAAESEMDGLDFLSSRRWRGIAASASVALVLSACGSGSPKTVTVVEVQHHAKGAVLRVPHTGKPSQCTVWLTSGSAIVTFQGNGYPVAPTCNAWITNSARKGTLWTTQMPTNIGPYMDGSQVCSLRGHNGWEYATVVDVSSDVDGYGQSSCEGLLSTGQWTERPAPSSANYVPPKPPASPPVATSTPLVKIGNWIGRQPSLIGFSADGGNIVTNLRWTTWGKTQALGVGQSAIQTCIPSCAAGGVMPVSAYVLLSDPVNGRFMHMTESQGGEITHSISNGKTPTLAQLRTQGMSFWPMEALSYKQALKEYQAALDGG